MTDYYVDTSVLLKRHVDELGSCWFEELVDSSESILTTALSLIEVYSAFNRLVRESRLSENEYQELLIDLKDLFGTRYELIPISTSIITDACNRLERHPLRAYDSVHLASAIFANQVLLTSGKPGMTFLSADHRLLTAAAAEGLSTFDPAAAR